jgi:hypothetical protein
MLTPPFIRVKYPYLLRKKDVILVAKFGRCEHVQKSPTFSGKLTKGLKVSGYLCYDRAN